MKPLRKLGAIGASLALAATAVVAATPAGAETFGIDSELGGGLILYPADGDPTELPMTEGSTFVGSYDNATGALEGNVTIQPGIAEVDPGLDVGMADLYYSFSDHGAISDGTIDADGNVSFIDTKSIELTKVVALDGAIELDLTENCVFGPLDLIYSGSYDFDTGEADVLSADVSVDPVGEGDCGALTDTINDMLAGSSAQANLIFSFDAEAPATEEPVTTLSVLTEPAVDSQITVDGVIANNWGVHDLDVSPGVHEVCFSDVDGFINPGCEVVTVAEGDSVTVTGEFSAQTFLNVSTEPAVNSLITVDGDPANNWGVHGLPVSAGEHEVCFSDVDGFAAPDCEVVDAPAGEVTSVTGQFTEDAEASGPEGLGMLRVESIPAVASLITVDGVAADTWGLDWMQIAPGNHEVCFGDVAGFVNPGCEQVVVEAGQTTEVTGQFDADDIGFLDVRNEPGVDVGITVEADGDLIARGNWGMDISLPAGDYVVCFGDSAEYGPPSVPLSGCAVIEVDPGQTTTVTAAYGDTGEVPH